MKRFWVWLCADAIPTAPPVRRPWLSMLENDR